MDALQTADDKALIHRCWEAGDLTYLLHSGQVELTGTFEEAAGRLYVICCSRRYGKSFWLCVLGIMKCISEPNMQVRYAAPTGRMCRSIVEPHMVSILADCPKKMKPSYRRQQGKWTFPNGSEFVMAGCDLQGAERLRGTSTDLGLIDEAGFIDDLKYVFGDILLPQLITTNGRILMVSTPARSPAHPFTNYCIKAKLDGVYQHRTIFDAPHIPHEVAVEFINEVGGVETTTARREYLAEVVVDEDLAIVPEFFKNEEQIVVEGGELPPFFDAYVFADFGFNDLTAIGFYVFDFKRGRLIKIGELEFARANTSKIAPAIAEMERQLWGDRQPFARIADAPLQQLADLHTDHGLAFAMARKDDADAALNGLRIACTNFFLEIWESACPRTIAHLRHGIWRKSRRDFERSDEFGHFDFIHETTYAVRHVDRSKNPYPLLPEGVQNDTHWVQQGGAGRESDSANSVRQLIGRGPWGR